MEYIRSFIAIELPQEVKQLLTGLQSRLKKGDYPVKWVEPGSIHLTLKFLGDVAADKIDLITTAIEVAASGTAPLRLAVSEPGVFPNPKRVQIIWVGLSGDLTLLTALQKSIEAEVSPLGFPTEARPFTPHLTLGRVRDYTSPEERQNLGGLIARTVLENQCRFEVKSVNLMRSQLTQRGAIYSCIQSVPLR
ncbi:MAG: RNA 2',3'-cyclic phosphodiesterase [Dehalococcoidales bacterium]|nr:RNA 2',3'-cyclic phosphodiesterase [Dehalococcoidales bacterium]